MGLGAVAPARGPSVRRRKGEQSTMHDDSTTSDGPPRVYVAAVVYEYGSWPNDFLCKKLVIFLQKNKKLVNEEKRIIFKSRFKSSLFMQNACFFKNNIKFY